jgi:hypothetical protein
MKIEPLNIIRFYEAYKSSFSGMPEDDLKKQLDMKMPALSTIRSKISSNSNPVLIFFEFSKYNIFK